MVYPSIDPRDQLMELSSYPNFDLSVGYRQIKSEPTIFVMLSYSWLFPRAYTIISFGSDQCYRFVHIVVEFHLHGNLDDLLLIPSAIFPFYTWFMLDIYVSVGNFWRHFFMLAHEAYVRMKEVTSSNSCAFDASCRHELENACFCFLWNHPKSAMHVQVFCGLLTDHLRSIWIP